jgi:Ca2+-binding EF-hand superfamily protein
MSLRDQIQQYCETESVGLADVFQLFDIDGCGCIDRAEFLEVMNAVVLKLIHS